MTRISEIRTQTWGVQVGEGEGVVAQRRVRVTTSPAGRRASASDTGSHGRRNGRRVQAGIKATAAPAIRA